MSTDTTNAQKAASGFPLAGLLTLIFVLAKVFGIGPIAAWSWIWVLSPLWIGFAIVVGFLAVIGIIIGLLYGIAHLASWIGGRESRKVLIDWKISRKNPRK